MNNEKRITRSKADASTTFYTLPTNQTRRKKLNDSFTSCQISTMSETEDTLSSEHSQRSAISDIDEISSEPEKCLKTIETNRVDVDKDIHYICHQLDDSFIDVGTQNDKRKAPDVLSPESNSLVTKRFGTEFIEFNSTPNVIETIESINPILKDILQSDCKFVDKDGQLNLFSEIFRFRSCYASLR